MFPYIVVFDNRRKNRPQVFFHWKVRLYFSKIWFFINLLGPKELILLLAQYLSDYLLDLYTSSLEVCTTRYYEKKKTPKYFNHWKVCLFFKNLWFQQPPRSLKKCSGKLHSISRNSLWTLVSCSLRFIILHKTGKKGKIFCHLKTAIFWNACFYRPLRSQRKDDIFCTIHVKRNRGLL